MHSSTGHSRNGLGCGTIRRFPSGQEKSTFSATKCFEAEHDQRLARVWPQLAESIRPGQIRHAKDQSIRTSLFARKTT